MSEQEAADITERLESLGAAIPTVLRWIKGLLAGAFALGIWVATMQIRLTTMEKEQAAATIQRTSNELRIRSVENLASAQNATTNAKLETIHATLEKIERLIPK